MYEYGITYIIEIDDERTMTDIHIVRGGSIGEIMKEIEWITNYYTILKIENLTLISA